MKIKLLLILSLFVCSQGSQAQWINHDVPFSGSSNYITFIDIESTSPNTVWGCPYMLSTAGASSSSRQYFRSIDGGVTWPNFGVMTGTPTGYLVSNIWPMDSLTCYAAMYNGSANGGNIFRTVDGGLTWTNLNAYNASSIFPNIVYFYDAAHGLTMGDPQGGNFEIYTTSDSGNTWTRTPSANIPLPSVVGEYGTANSFSASQGHIWYTTTHGYVYHSADSGMTWTKSATGFSPNIGTTQRIDISDIAFVDSLHGMVIQEPYDTSIAGPGPFVKTTSDGGITWTSISYYGTLFTWDLDVIPGRNVYVSAGTNFAVGGTGAGTSYSIDNGLNWTLIDTAVSHTTIDFFDATHGFTGEIVPSPFLLTTGLWQYDPTSGPVGLIPVAETKLSLDLYPNPTQGIVHYNFKAGKQSRVKIAVFNAMGQEVYAKDFGTVSGMFNETLDLQSFTKGLYVVRLINGENTYQQKVIVQ